MAATGWPARKKSITWPRVSSGVVVGNSAISASSGPLPAAHTNFDPPASIPPRRGIRPVYAGPVVHTLARGVGGRSKPLQPSVVSEVGILATRATSPCSLFRDHFIGPWSRFYVGLVGGGAGGRGGGRGGGGIGLGIGGQVFSVRVSSGTTFIQLTSGYQT